MNTRKFVYTSIFAMGFAAAMQAGEARELPESIQQFSDAQQQQILVQGFEARRAIAWKMKSDFEAERVAFIESQIRGIEEQGEFALASIRDELQGVELVGWPGADGNRYSFMDVQRGGMAAQGRAALDAIKSDLRLVGLDHPAGGMPPGRTDAANWPSVAASTR